MAFFVRSKESSVRSQFNVRVEGGDQNESVLTGFFRHRVNTHFIARK